jgi:hypothetical protein
MWSDAMAPDRQREAVRNSPERSECISGLGAPRTRSGRVTPTQRPHGADGKTVEEHCRERSVERSAERGHGRAPAGLAEMP